MTESYSVAHEIEQTADVVDASLPNTTFEDCRICYEKFEDNGIDIMITRCNHKFHASCMCSWMQKKQTCPGCNADLAQKATMTLERALDPNDPLIRAVEDERQRQAERMVPVEHPEAVLAVRVERFVRQIPQQIWNNKGTLLYNAFLFWVWSLLSQVAWRNSMKLKFAAIAVFLELDCNCLWVGQQFIQLMGQLTNRVFIYLLISYMLTSTFAFIMAFTSVGSLTYAYASIFRTEQDAVVVREFAGMPVELQFLGIAFIAWIWYHVGRFIYCMIIGINKAINVAAGVRNDGDDAGIRIVFGE